MNQKLLLVGIFVERRTLNLYTLVLSYFVKFVSMAVEIALLWLLSLGFVADVYSVSTSICLRNKSKRYS